MNNEQRGLINKVCNNPSRHEADCASHPIGQHSVLELTTAPLPVVRVGFIGVGERGRQAVMRWCHIPHTEIVAICDLDAGHVKEAQTVIADNGRKPCAITDNAETLCERDDVDLVYICTDWESHAALARCAMEHGKHVAVEVPAAMTIKDCWSLVDMAELRQLHCMMLENTCYDYFEMATAAMAHSGRFGKIVNAVGGYHHWLDKRWEPWRLSYNRTHRGDIYPTHGFGPVCRALDIHRTDFLETLVSMDSAAVSGPDYYKRLYGEDVKDFSNGDVTTTIIRTRLGRTIVLDHDVMTPRPYSRLYQIVGTSGFAAKYPQETLWLDGRELSAEERESEISKWLPDDIREARQEAAQYDDRGGISFIMDCRLVNNLQLGRPMDMDVYDLAEWCAVVELSRKSIEGGSIPVPFPDFTRQAVSSIGM